MPAFAGDVKIIVAGRVRYPDVAATCAKLNLTDDIVPEPVLVVEVLSSSTAHTDRTLKVEEYQLTPSIQHYLLLEQDSAEGVMFTRQDQEWIAEAVTAAGDIPLPAFGIRIPMADVYRLVIAQV